MIFLSTFVILLKKIDTDQKPWNVKILESYKVSSRSKIIILYFILINWSNSFV